MSGGIESHGSEFPCSPLSRDSGSDSSPVDSADMLPESAFISKEIPMFRVLTLCVPVAALGLALIASPASAADKAMDPAKKAACIEACNTCLQACRECVTGCDCAMCETDCLTCIETCKACVALMQYESSLSPQMCGLCADACEACAKACLECADMPCCQKCAKACQRCVETCRAMAS